MFSRILAVLIAGIAGASTAHAEPASRWVKQAASSPMDQSETVTFKPPLAYLLPVKLSSGPRAERLATPDPSNTSGDFAGLLGSDGFVELPAGGSEFPAGTVVGFRPWA